MDGVQQGVSYKREWHAKGAMREQQLDYTIFRIVDSHEQLYYNYKHHDRRGRGDIRLTVL